MGSCSPHQQGRLENQAWTNSHTVKTCSFSLAMPKAPGISCEQNRPDFVFTELRPVLHQGPRDPGDTWVGGWTTISRHFQKEGRRKTMPYLNLEEPLKMTLSFT